MTERDPTRLLPLRPRVFAILLALAESPLHGYGLMRRLSEDGEGGLLGPGTLYRLLKEMQADGLIVATPGGSADSDGPPRRYYTLSGFGGRVARAEGDRMAELVLRTRNLVPAKSE
jgi:DNA-binding PadR family transcriptional regulator